MTVKDAAVSYARMGWAVLPLEEKSKEPATRRGFKDAKTDPSIVERVFTDYPECNVGVACGQMSGGLVIIDLDVDEDEDGIEWLDEWERENGKLPETACEVTGRGGMHLFYKVDREVRPSVNKSIGVDVRGDGSYVMVAPSVHPNGNTVYWDLSPEDVGVAEASDLVYKLIDDVRPSGYSESKRLEIPNKVGKGERDVTMYRFACSMRAKDMSFDEALEACKSLNASRFEPPMSILDVTKKVKSAYRNPAGLSDEAKATAKAAADKPKGPGRPRKFEHNTVAKALISKRGACTIDGVPAIREGDVYKTGWDAIDRAIYEMHDDATMANLREVKHYVQIRAPKKKQSRATLIGFANGVLDIETMLFREYNSSDVIPNVIPHDWDASAQSDVLESFVDRVSCGDMSVSMNLGEVIGLCMFRDATRFAYCPVLLGGGSNGKSTYINFLRYVIGDENISSMQPEEISKRFQGVNVVGKTANLGDDISSGYLDDSACSTIKKIATGDTIYTDVKGGSGFDFKPYCTMVFSANNFPRLADSSDGMMRRLFPIEFNARFKRGAADFDPTIIDKLKTEECARAALALGVESLRRMLSTSEMTPNEASQRIVAEMVADNNTVLQWLNDMPNGADSIVGMTRKQAYSMYREWAEQNGYSRTMATSRTMTKNLATFGNISLSNLKSIDYVNGGKRERVFARNT